MKSIGALLVSMNMLRINAILVLNKNRKKSLAVSYGILEVSCTVMSSPPQIVSGEVISAEAVWALVLT